MVLVVDRLLGPTLVRAMATDDPSKLVGFVETNRERRSDAEGKNGPDVFSRWTFLKYTRPLFFWMPMLSSHAVRGI
jgi:hypothetical protein